MAGPVRAAFYVRVSTDSQAQRDEGSLETQEQRLRAALQARGEIEPEILVFREEGQSGKDLNRPEMHRLLAAIRSGAIDRLMVTRLDRLSRSLKDFYELHELMEQHHVEFVSLHETFDTSTPVGRAMLKLILVFAELERETTAERTRASMRARAERGLWNGGAPVLGYDAAVGGVLQINEEEATVVRLAFTKYIELRSANKVARWLNEQGHRRKVWDSRRKGNRGGQKFSKDSILNMLTNEHYRGNITHKGSVHEGRHTAIVDDETWTRTREIRERNSVNQRGTSTRIKYDYLLTGLLRCDCGGALTPSSANSRGKRYHYYRCVAAQKRPDHTCPVGRMSAETLDQAILNVVRDAAKDPALVQEALAEAERIHLEMVQPKQDELRRLRSELDRAQAKATQLVEASLSDGLGATRTLKRMLSEVETQIGQLEGAIATARGDLDHHENSALNAELVLQALRCFDAAFDHLSLPEKRELIALLVSSVRVHKDHAVVALYEGGAVLTRLGGNRTDPAVPGAVPTKRSDREHADPAGALAPDPAGFVPGGEWHPRLDSNQWPTV